MIYDCFTFFDELELLDLRLQTLAPVVDKFVLVESTVTFTGHQKPLYFEEHREQFDRYRDKIIHVIVEDSPPPTSPQNVWNVEHFQRNAILRGLKDAPCPDSRIMVSDVDEIPDPRAVAIAAGWEGLVGFRLLLHYYYVNCRCNKLWNGTVMADLGCCLTPQQMRSWRSRCPRYCEAPAGWHFSYLGGPEAICKKIAAFAEVQVNTPENRDHQRLLRCMETGQDLFGGGVTNTFVPIDDSYPPGISQWLSRYPYLVK